MKMPQRSFVVEFKSGRRRSTARPDSIWGDTDFKALAREVEQKAPHLFNSEEAPGEPSSRAAADAIDAVSASEHVGEKRVAREASVSSTGSGFELPIQPEAERQAVKAGGQGQGGNPLPPRALRSTARQSARRIPVRKKSAKDTKDDARAQSAAIEHPISLDELAALEAENKRLKSLLAEQLRVQNVQLKTMLARFSAA
ncbi:hypothetical protein [Sinorhizobium fredii]|uniref:Uncharacterized protein n=1 Tax=Rhizobium fredii TaxID=380 RepID=A0A2L0HDA0_RHIFR|nr:hypothetical protein [Sinorhizobium fredii]AUX79471.1 hypothetical protein NXT3_PC00298 [Sinorhizobium fredii]